jgi:hypothetical protein
VQGHPLAIGDVRRILLAHATAACETYGVACGPHDARGGLPSRTRGHEAGTP